MQAKAPKRWTRDELLVVLNLYHKLPFGKISERQPVVIDLATKLGRTPASVSMKLGNLASFDPVLKLRGVSGLTGASALDREVWDEYHDNAAEMIPLGQERFDALFTKGENESTEVIPGEGIRRIRKRAGDATESTGKTKQRRGQNYFRDIVLNNYEGRCAVTGMPIREFLIASHILPWSSYEAERLNVRNGISLNRLFDAAFDQHFISFDDDLRLLFLPRLIPFLKDSVTSEAFAPHEGKTLNLSPDGIPPNPEFLEIHRSRANQLNAT